ncbi:MAG: hypothetical protein AB7H77_03355 [Bdellovibrionales bacterium]
MSSFADRLDDANNPELATIQFEIVFRDRRFVYEPKVGFIHRGEQRVELSPSLNALLYYWVRNAEAPKNARETASAMWRQSPTGRESLRAARFGIKQKLKLIGGEEFIISSSHRIVGLSAEAVVTPIFPKPANEFLRVARQVADRIVSGELSAEFPAKLAKLLEEDGVVLTRSSTHPEP